MIDIGREEDLLRRFWYAAAFSSAIDDGPVSIDILGEPIMVARLGDHPVAMTDRCPHRGAPLSQGDVVEHAGESCLRCPYHALHFDSSGAAVHVPGRPGDRLPSRLDLDPLTCIERHGIVWVCLVDDPLGDVPDWSAFDEPTHAHVQLDPEQWESMPSRITENFNDLAHFATVHASTFGDASNPVVPPVEIEVSDKGLSLRHRVALRQLDRVTIDAPAESIDVDYLYTHVMPFSTELRIRFDAARTEWIQMTATPTGPTSAIVFMQNSRDFDVEGDLIGWRDFQTAVNQEDRRLLDLLQPNRIALDDADATEVALSMDTFTIAFRRVWRQLLGS